MLQGPLVGWGQVAGQGEESSSVGTRFRSPRQPGRAVLASPLHHLRLTHTAFWPPPWSEGWLLGACQPEAISIISSVWYDLLSGELSLYVNMNSLLPCIEGRDYNLLNHVHSLWEKTLWTQLQWLSDRLFLLVKKNPRKSPLMGPCFLHMTGKDNCPGGKWVQAVCPAHAGYTLTTWVRPASYDSWPLFSKTLLSMSSTWYLQAKPA